MQGGAEAVGRTAGGDRRSAVLDAALTEFARFGYRKTSMDDIAAAARISRPGLYFLFSSKGELFRAAIERAIALDLADADAALRRSDRSLVERVVGAFDAWAGRYVGPFDDIPALVEAHPDAVAPEVSTSPARFDRMLVAALREHRPIREARALSRVLTSVSIGLKHQVDDRGEYVTRMREAARILLDPA